MKKTEAAKPRMKKFIRTTQVGRPTSIAKYQCLLAEAEAYIKTAQTLAFIDWRASFKLAEEASYCMYEVHECAADLTKKQRKLL